MRFRLGVVAFWICVLFSTICHAVSVSGIPAVAYVGDTIAFHAEEAVGGDLQTYSYCKFVYYPHADGVQYQPDVYGNQAQASNNYENINKGQTIKFDGSFIVKEEMLEGKSEKAGEFTVHVWCFKDAVFSNTPTWASYPAKVTWTAKKQPVSSCSSSANNISLNYLKVSADKLKFDIKFTNGQCEDIQPHYYVYLDGKQEMDEYGQTTSPKTSSTLTYTINKLITPGDHVVKVCLVSSQGGDCNTDPFTWAPTVGCQCAADEECTPNGCVKKTGCPPCPSGKTCNNGQCTPIKTCTPGETICTNDDKYEVLDANCNPITSVQCKTNEYCTAYGCLLKTGCQYDLPKCNEGEVCNTSTGKCVCVLKQYCKGNVATTSFPDCTEIKTDCSAKNGTCLNGICDLKGCQYGVPKCQTGQTCNLNTGQCEAEVLKCSVGYTCTKDGTGYYYENGKQCVEPALPPPCPVGQKCSGGVCKNVICSSKKWCNADKTGYYMEEPPNCAPQLVGCAGSDICSDGACTTKPEFLKTGCQYNNPPCKPNEECKNDVCVQVKCDEEWKCVGPLPIAFQVSNTCGLSEHKCKPGAFCYDGNCSSQKGCAYNDPACGPGETCSGNKCIGAKKCVPKPTCAADGKSYQYLFSNCSTKTFECQQNEVCKDGLCEPLKGCQYGNPPCPNGSTCANNECYQGCKSGFYCVGKMKYEHYKDCKLEFTKECFPGEVCSDVKGIPICTKSLCTSGDCCDLKTEQYLPYGIVCGAQAEKEYGCPQGDGAVYVKYQDKVCSGQYHECYQLSQNWSEWAKVEDCDSYSKCVAGQSKCQGACVDAWECVENNTAKAHHLSNCKWKDTTYCGKSETCVKGECVAVGGAGGSGGVCDIVLARWNKTQVTSGEQVPMDVLTTPGCNGKNVEFKVHKTGKTASWWNIFGILTKFKRTKVVDGVASIDWKAQYVADWQSPPEFSFIATVDGKSKFSENTVKVTAFQTVDWATLKSNFANKPVIIFKPTAPSAALDQQITLLKSALEKVAKSVEIKLPDLKGNCFLTSAASSSIVVIGTAMTNPLYACGPKDADPDSGVYATANPWSESDEFGAVWIRSEVGDNSFFNIYTFRDAMLDQAFITDVETKAWDYSTACFYEGDFSKVYYPKFGALICYAIPASQLVPDVRAIWKNCSLFSALLVANPMGDPMVISIDNWMPGTLTNYMMCKMVIGMFALDVMGAAGTIKTVTGLAKATGTGPLGKFALQLKGLLDAAENGNKELTDLVLKVLPFKWSSSLKSAQKAVIENAADDGDDLAMAVLKDQALGPDVAEKAFGYMSKLAKPSGGWTPEAIEGIGNIFKSKLDGKLPVVLADKSFREVMNIPDDVMQEYYKNILPLNSDAALRASVLFSDGKLVDEIVTIRKALAAKPETLGQKTFEIVFGGKISKDGKSAFADDIFGKMEPNEIGGASIYIRTSKLGNYDDLLYTSAIKHVTIPHELGEEALHHQFGKAMYDKFEKEVISDSEINEHFVETLLIRRALDKGIIPVLNSPATLYVDTKDVKSIVSVAIEKKFLGTIATELATAEKYKLPIYKDDLLTALSYGLDAQLKKKFPGLSVGEMSVKITEIMDKVQDVALKIGKVGDDIATHVEWTVNSPEYNAAMSDLAAQLKTLYVN